MQISEINISGWKMWIWPFVQSKHPMIALSGYKISVIPYSGKFRECKISQIHQNGLQKNISQS